MKKIKLLLLMCVTVIISCFTILSGCSNTAQSKKVWVVGVNVPTNQTEGEIGALYLNTSTYDIYQKQEDSTWEKIGNIKVQLSREENGTTTISMSATRPSSTAGVIRLLLLPMWHVQECWASRLL